MTEPAGQEQKYLPLSPGMSVSMTEIRTSVTLYVSEYDCVPGRPGTEMRTCVTRYVNEYDNDPGRAGTEIRTSVTRHANEHDRNTYLCHPVCQ